MTTQPRETRRLPAATPRPTSSLCALAIGLVFLVAKPGVLRATDAGVGNDGEAAVPSREGADAGTGPDGALPGGVQPPRLVATATATYPEAAAAAELEAVVPLVLTVGVDGAVTAVVVESPVGHGFDEAATAAARQYRFEPARVDGRAVAARIRHSYVFALAAPAPADAGPPDTGPSDAGPPPVAPSRAPVGGKASAATVALDVTVKGASAARRLRGSAQAVTVIETERAKRESADLGEVMARTQGVSVRRGGGLGSGAQLSLNGLSDDQVRFFLDGLPLDVMGFGLGMQNVPVNLIERVEIYRGVVPVRFGADALGGAVNLVSDESLRGTRASASAQAGAFGTYRLTAAGRYTHPGTGLFAGGNAFVDHADNDYPIDVEVPDERGRLSPARVYRFHDGYSAYGATAEVGVVGRSWAKRLGLRGFATRQAKEIQNNIVMTVPYGEARYWETVRGATVRYEEPQIAGSRFGAEATLSVSRRVTHFRDLSPSVYDWFGRAIRARVRPGELGYEPSDERIWQYTALGRLGFSFTPTPEHALRLALSPTQVSRRGRDYLVTTGRDPLSARREYQTLTSGLEYQADLWQRRIQAVLFGKSYRLATDSEENLPGGIFRRLEESSHTWGYGAAVRVRPIRPLWAKASYERATRLPTPDELFGNGVLILPNLHLSPERSHNANLSLTLDWARTPAGDWRGEINGFLRHAQNLVVLLGNDMVFSYQNVYTARSQGVETSGGWTSPEGYLSLDGNLTWQSLRNATTEGTFGDFDGDRIPNRPWFFGNATARLQKTRVASPRDELSLTYHLRYVKAFFRGWESLGLRAFKQVVPDQTTHGLALTYVGRGQRLTLTWTGELANLTDARTYDFFGVQRPGRAFYAKLTAEY